jgi:CheY-like chemotaxis protein
VTEFAEGACGKGELILLAEDDGAVRQLVKVTLKEAGFNVLSASDGFEALEVEESHSEPIDLLLTDVVMPNLSGFDLAKIMRKTRPDLQVVFMSGYPSRGDLKAVEVPEDAAFLQKPVNPPALIFEVRKALDLAESKLNEGGGTEDV